MMVRMVMTTTAATRMVITVAFLEIDMFSMHFLLKMRLYRYLEYAGFVV